MLCSYYLHSINCLLNELKCRIVDALEPRTSMSLTETRIANARLVIERAGGKTREGRLRQVLQLLR